MHLLYFSPIVDVSAGADRHPWTMCVTVSASATARMTYRFIAAANDAAKTYPGFLGGGFRGLLTIICYVCIATYTGMHALHAYAMHVRNVRICKQKITAECN